MPFEDLPAFRQGEGQASDSGSMGIPPEKFQQALQDPGYETLTSRRPEDSPAVRQVIDTEVDALSTALGHPAPAVPAAESQPPAQPLQTGTPPQPPAPQHADPGQPPQGADLSKRPLEERIQGIMQKYDGNFERLAEAHAHADAARTRAQQQNAGYRQDLSALTGRFDRIESMLAGRPDGSQQYGNPNAPAGPGTPAGQEKPLTGDDLLSNPEVFLDRMEKRVDGVVRNHLLAYTNAQAQHSQNERAETMRRERHAEIEELRPVMDEIYYAKPWLYDRMPQHEALTELLDRAKDRQAANNAVTYHREIKAAYGDNGTPAAGAAPSTTGALPQAGGGQGRRPAAGATTNYSDTPAMNRLWRSRSDSREEMKAVTDILKERGFGEDLKIY